MKNILIFIAQIHDTWPWIFKIILYIVITVLDSIMQTCQYLHQKTKKIWNYMSNLAYGSLNISSKWNRFTPGFKWSSCYSLVLCVCFVDSLVLFLLAIVLSVLLCFTNSDYPLRLWYLQTLLICSNVPKG